VNTVAENVWHILEVSPRSPAEKAGLVAYTDFVIGSPMTLLDKEDTLGKLIEEVNLTLLLLMNICLPE
jgi:hypothetical protein